MPGDNDDRRGGFGSVSMPPFKPDDSDSCVPAWTAYKREFRVHLAAAGLDEQSGKRQVNTLLKCMGINCIKLYDTFEWAPAVAAVPADVDNNIPAVAAREAENKDNLEDVCRKFDNHWGVQRYRSIKRQEFLDTKRGPDQPIMDFIAELKRKANLCEYGENKDSFICDKIINGVNDERCSERLLDLPDNDLTLDRVMGICRQVELTKAHLKLVNASQQQNQKEVKKVRTDRDGGANRSGHRGRARGRGRRGQAFSDRRQFRQDDRRQGDRCDRCCRSHAAGDCRASEEYCGACGEKGHYKRSPLCRAQSGRRGDRQTHPPRGRRGYSRGRGRSVHNVHTEYDDRFDEQFYDDLDNLTVEDIFVASCQSDDDRDVYYDAKCVIDDVCDDSKCVNVYDVKCVVDDVYCDTQGGYDDSRCASVSRSDETCYDDSECINVFSSHSEANGNDWYVNFLVKGRSLSLEIDTAAHCNIISLNTVKRLGFESCIAESKILVNGVHNNPKRAYGSIILPCTYKRQEKILEFQILDSVRDINLLGRPDSLKLNLVARVNAVTASESCRSLVKKFDDVLGKDIGCLPGQFEIKIDSSVRPVIHPPRSLPAAIRDQVKRELDHLEKSRIITAVREPTEWVNSMVVVRKKNGRVRICIGPSDLNKAIRREHYPMSTLEDIATRLHGSKLFSTLDANSGYFQVMLTEASSRLTTFNTPFGRYRYLRMPMGLKCSAEVFQREMQTHFGDLQGVEVVVDDILVHGRSDSEHNARLCRVLERAREIGLKLNEEKSQIGVQEVNYVGHCLTGHGLKPTKERVEAITKMRAPENLSELETMLGMIAYVSKFIPGLSQLNAPLRDLKKEDEWHWGDKEQKVLDAIKKVLTSDPVLKYYDVNKPVLLSVDASTRGLGAALIQGDAVVAYASRALSPTEQRYAQIEKEALAVVFSCVKFHKMIYGKHITIESDHKPLESIVRKPIYAAPMRIQKMLLKLQPYSFTLVHVSGKSIGLADCLSRLPQGKSEALMDDELMVCPVDAVVGKQHATFVAATEEDPELQDLRRVILAGWPELRSQLPPGVAPYWSHRYELSTYNGLVFKGDRVVVPAALRTEMINLLHKPHMGIVLTKQRARDLMYWPGMNSQIEDVISKCATRLQHRNSLPKEPMIVHPLPSLPWSKVGADLFELQGKHYLLLVDTIPTL